MSICYKLLIYESVVFFELEDFVGVPYEVFGNLQRNDGRRHIASGLDEVDRLLTADLHFNYTKGQLYNAFVDGGDHWMIQTMNGRYGSELGSNVTLSYVPWSFLAISIDGTADYQTFKAGTESDAVHHWFFPVYGNIAAYWKDFTLSYRHTLVGQSLSEIYLEGYEKISYINLSWRKNRLTIGLQCLFPFVEDRFVSETTEASPVLHKTSTNLRTKNHEFGLSLSYNFVKGKGKYSNKSINNSDSDTGVFEF